MSRRELPVPPHFNKEKAGEVWRVPYQQRATDALAWARRHQIAPSSSDIPRILLILIDVQNTFCIPGFELFVQGRSGTGAVDDNIRLCRFIYKNLHWLTEISPTMDTHQLMQIFHPLFLVNEKGENPAPLTSISLQDIERGVWKVNPDFTCSLSGGDHDFLQRHLLHYARKLREGGKYELMIWPYHAMLGGIGHCLVASVEEAIFFHNVARSIQSHFEVKGANPLTENYSVLHPEVPYDVEGDLLVPTNIPFIKKLLDYDRIVITGQAKSHCLAWTLDDLLSEVFKHDRKLAEKVYILEDCTSPVVVPGVVDFSDEASQAFNRFRDEGMSLVKSTTPIEDWPGMKLS